MSFNFNKKKYWLFAISFLLLSNCNNENETFPNASYTVDKAFAVIMDTIYFTNTSKFASSYLWDFGDGSSSTVKNPFHVYSIEGDYKVTLKATGPGGESSFSKNISINYFKPIADFSIEKSIAEFGETIEFFNQSKHATNYLWDFGDGTTSTDVNPSHSYSYDGNYAITLTIKGRGGTTTTKQTITIQTNLDGTWVAYTTEGDEVIVSAHLKFHIYDKNVNITDWWYCRVNGWDFRETNTETVLSELNTFTFDRMLGFDEFIYEICIVSSTIGNGIFTHRDKKYPISVIRQ